MKAYVLRALASDPATGIMVPVLFTNPNPEKEDAKKLALKKYTEMLGAREPERIRWKQTGPTTWKSNDLGCISFTITKEDYQKVEFKPMRRRICHTG